MKQFAFVSDGGKGHKVELAEACPAHQTAALVWVHLDANDPATREWLSATARLPDLVINALTAMETRPRCEAMEGGALINLRGLALHDDDGADDLVSIRIWTERGRIISVGRYTLRALPGLAEAMKNGKVVDPGDFVAMLAAAITEELDPDVTELGDELDDCEVMLDANRAFALRRTIAVARSRAIEYRRFVVPQRQALEKLAGLDCDWLEDDDRSHLTEAADRFARMAEELESIRERAALMHEQITDLRAEVIDTRALLISIVALVFLPLTFITGLLGMNVDGIPFAHEPWAFAAVCGLCLALGLVVVGYFVKVHWIND